MRGNFPHEAFEYLEAVLPTSVEGEGAFFSTGLCQCKMEDVRIGHYVALVHLVLPNSLNQSKCKQKVPCINLFSISYLQIPSRLF